MITHFGNFDLIELATPQTFNPATGITTQRRFKLLKTSAPAFTASLTAQGYAWEYSPDDGSPYATVTTLTSPELTTTWTLDGNDLEVPIWQLPAVQAMLSKIPDFKDRANIRADIESIVRGDFANDNTRTVASIKAVLLAVATGPVAPGLPNVDGRLEQIFEELLRNLIAGAEAFPVSTYVLRKTQVLSPVTNVSPGFQNANKVFTLPALVRDEPGIPLNIAGILTDIGGYWRKTTPQASQGADGRWTYTVEYWWAETVSEFLYEVIQ